MSTSNDETRRKSVAREYIRNEVNKAMAPFYRILCPKEESTAKAEYDEATRETKEYKQ